ncbi:phage tail protein [Klebsiella quasipneumoniae subsp. similipneumoniae]|uniref:phage tail protein n=2 Tax=Klebsiella pneumoniae complex TaxID=3390273 RepID=UPI00081C02B6|nr:phage tail protein [Klebsiella quasipneumoniae]MDZ0693873.1 phage tail protein [Klebsiella quasipneumoniae]OCV63974.1 phage tail protein [Klebsiella quasipneumoniae subsp. similipneumoniae]OVU09294.1 phage tail protein [Klebsiella quasipneumoniae subsp. similipneumoniae]OVV85672.1 phage tail protein [Klebsiella quasipneumoniae subsp. similipneumoniae]SSW58957.1 Tail fiber protein [Klebsiella quasipneumoniae]
MKKYFAMLTDAGIQKFAEAALSGEPVGFSHMGVGDGGGTLPQPYATQTGLINELYRAPLNRLVIADGGANIIRAEMVMFPQVGGFWLREAALYDDDGVCLALANLPPSYKPLLAEGSGRQQAVNLWIAVNNTADVRLVTDPAVVIASLGEVNRAKNEAKDYADKIINELDINIQQAITEAVKTAVRDAWEEDNPPGTTRFFNQNLNPNERWPWSQWVYTGENKTIRVAKADGSNVGTTGGSDTVTLQKANLPAVQIDVSGETSEQAEQKLTTTRGGVHNHGGVAGKDDPWEIGGDVRQLFNPKELGVTDDAGEHDHEVTVPPHKHTTSGKTANLGTGQSFSVVEAHTLLMCWSRVA